MPAYFLGVRLVDQRHLKSSLRDFCSPTLTLREEGNLGFAYYYNGPRAGPT